jgi:hypothetical protein
MRPQSLRSIVDHRLIIAWLSIAVPSWSEDREVGPGPDAPRTKTAPESPLRIRSSPAALEASAVGNTADEIKAMLDARAVLTARQAILYRKKRLPAGDYDVRIAALGADRYAFVLRARPRPSPPSSGAAGGGAPAAKTPKEKGAKAPGKDTPPRDPPRAVESAPTATGRAPRGGGAGASEPGDSGSEGEQGAGSGEEKSRPESGDDEDDDPDSSSDDAMPKGDGDAGAAARETKPEEPFQVLFRLRKNDKPSPAVRFQVRSLPRDGRWELSVSAGSTLGRATVSLLAES